MKSANGWIPIAASFASLLSATLSHGIVGQPGTLDTLWATTGKVVTQVGTGDDIPAAALLQPDGKIVVAGSCYNGSNFDFCAVRYLPTGALDPSFNGSGKVVTPVGASNDGATTALLQTDGKIVVAGTCNNGGNFDFCAVRYLPNGILDTNFNTTGKVITPVGPNYDGATAALLQPDGKIVIVGSCINVAGNRDFCAARYLSTGALDTTFNGTGTVITSVGAAIDDANAALLQPDGKIVLAGGCSNGASNSDFCVVRYLPSGALDTSFNGTGSVITPVVSSYSYAHAALLQPDGKIVVAGDCYSGSTGVFCAVRYMPTGALDTSFNGSGKIATPVGTGNATPVAALLQPDGRVLLAGNCLSSVTSLDFCAARYLPTGVLDTSFNGTGTVVTPLVSGIDRATAALLQPDGKIVLAGDCFNGTNYDFCVVRYDGGPFGYQNCKPDLDGDGQFLPTTDALIYTRIALGITGPAVVGGINFPANATRNTWPLIRDYLVTQCGMSLVQ
jgi:uncharacterized delta-60 repeat protein